MRYSGAVLLYSRIQPRRTGPPDRHQPNSHPGGAGLPPLRAGGARRQGGTAPSRPGGALHRQTTLGQPERVLHPPHGLRRWAPAARRGSFPPSRARGSEPQGHFPRAGRLVASRGGVSQTSAGLRAAPSAAWAVAWATASLRPPVAYPAFVKLSDEGRPEDPLQSLVVFAPLDRRRTCVEGVHGQAKVVGKCHDTGLLPRRPVGREHARVHLREPGPREKRARAFP